jgi:outer membrane protein OmpA-like peptidoglycan-associated protein
MSTDADTLKPDFAAAAGTLRDTVKWLAAAFAGTAALVIGNTPVSGLGKLAFLSGRWWLALLLLLAGFALICVALWRALRILKPDVLYRSSLLGTHDLLLDPQERKELTQLRKDIDAHGADLLPPKYPRLALLAQNLATIEQRLAALRANPSSEPDPVKRVKSIQEGTSARAKNWAAIARVLPLAQYLRLHRRFKTEQVWLGALSAAALLLLLAFAIVSTVPERKDDKGAGMDITIHCERACDKPPPPPPPSALPDLPALLFEPDGATVSRDGLATLQQARDALATHPRALLQLRVHTDTTAPRRHNDDLAHRRALAVLGLLSSQGGIAPERLLVSYLPETALPRVTPDQTARRENRSVELVWLEDTRR